MFEFFNLQIILFIHFFSFIWLIYLVYIIWINKFIFVDYSDCFLHHSFFIEFFHSFINSQSYWIYLFNEKKNKNKYKVDKIGFGLLQNDLNEIINYVVIVLKWNEKINHWMIGNFSMFLVFFQKSKLSLKNTFFNLILLNVINNIK